MKEFKYKHFTGVNITTHRSQIIVLTTHCLTGRLFFFLIFKFLDDVPRNNIRPSNSVETEEKLGEAVIFFTKLEVNRIVISYLFCFKVSLGLA